MFCDSPLLVLIRLVFSLTDWADEEDVIKRSITTHHPAALCCGKIFLRLVKQTEYKFVSFILRM
jgi:hypothetical protein